LAQSWKTDESSADIAPAKKRDGTVDIKDVLLMSEYWLRQIPEIGLAAHWKLDETEGFIADDSAGSHAAFVMSTNPLWWPTGGKIAGALELDGIDDFVSTPFVLDPAAGAFSVFAWVKGGKPEQVVISQAGGMNWLLADATEGKLMTELKSAGRDGQSLTSQAIIIDGNWHRVGFVWDRPNRKLYVDGVEVKKDTQAVLAGSTGGLQIGAGKNLEPGSFWSGLIDDVRVYDRPIVP